MRYGSGNLLRKLARIALNSVLVRCTLVKMMVGFSKMECSLSKMEIGFPKIARGLSKITDGLAN